MSAAIEQAESPALEQTSGTGTSDKVKFAVKTALSLTLAYLTPMALGWPQPQTAAITVMLIAATGSLSDSLQKGVLRTAGTVAGAIIGLSLIALFPQDRLLYLISISIVVSVLLYLYNAFQGDSTIFMLTMVVCLMVFNGGDAEGAFIYGIDRTLLTAFGVAIYSLVGSFLWPVKIADNTVQLAAAVSASFARTSRLLSGPSDTKDQEPADAELLEELLNSLETLRSHYVQVKYESDTVQAYQSEWNAILASYERLESIVIPALRSPGSVTPDFQLYIPEYELALANLRDMLERIQTSWSAEQADDFPTPVEIKFQQEALEGEKHLVRAAVLHRVNLLNELQDILQQLAGAVNSLRFDRGKFRREQEVQAAPSFIWLDRENLKTALRGFITFWIATLIWINFNPPGGFMFVTLSTALIALVSYTAVTPKLLIILFTLGFTFALPAYVFLLPAMSHWLQLALFLFTYAFIGFFLFPGPVAIFYLLGLFTLGIQNTMSYNFNVILLMVLLFYMVCALLIVSVHFPFTSKPERLYMDFRRRFFLLCADISRCGPPKTAMQRIRCHIRMTGAAVLVKKMTQWGGMIDASYFPDITVEKVTRLNHSCELLLGRLRALTGPRNPYSGNAILGRVDQGQADGLVAQLCDTLARQINPSDIEQSFSAARGDLEQVEEQLGEFLERNSDTPGDRQKDMANFYLYINLQASLLASLNHCRECLVDINWPQLAEKRF